MPRWMRDPFTRCLFAPEGDGAGGAAGTGDGAGAGAGGDAGAGAGGGGWTDGLAEDVRGHPEIAKFKDQGVEALAREHINAQALIGRKAPILPKDDASDEDWAKFYGDLGRPATAEEYKFTIPEGRDPTDADKAFQASMAPLLHGAGLSQRQTDKLNAGWNEIQAKQEEARQTRAAEAATATDKALTEKWGDKKAENMDLAQRAVRAYFGVQDTDLKTAKALQLADGTYLLDNQPLAEAMAALGAAQASDKLETGVAAGGDAMSSPASAKAEIARIRAASAEDKKHPLYNNKHPEHEAMNARMDQLYKVANPEKGGTA